MNTRSQEASAAPHYEELVMVLEDLYVAAVFGGVRKTNPQAMNGARNALDAVFRALPHLAPVEHRP